MKRYTVESFDRYDIEEAPDGMWVMHDDAQEQLQKLREALRYAIGQADAWHDDCRSGPIDTPEMNAARALLEGGA